MKREVGLGAGIGVLLFLTIKGFNVIPVVVLLGLMYFLLTSGGHLKDFGKRKVGAVVGQTPNITFDDVGGQAIAKRELLEALLFLKNYEDAKALGIRPLKGILLSGPPGTGKTLLAKAAANYTDSVFVSASGSEFIEVYAGLGAQRVRDLFARARKLAQQEKKPGAVIFIDEIEVLAGKRGTQVGHLEYDQTLNQLLVEMDGLGTNDDVRILVIGATNRPDLLDTAIQRPGRFDRMVKVDLPDKDGRLEILKLHLRNKPLHTNVDLDRLARETFGLSGAHLESLSNEAAILALRKGQKEITEKELEEALDKVIMGEKLDRKPSEAELRRVTVHEGGHAILAESVRPGSVAQVTVSPRGNALGYVRHTPKDDMYLYPKETIEEEIEILLAGAIAEDLVFGSKSTGASNDFARALDLAKRIVRFGMSPLGVVDRDTASPDALARATKDIIARAEEKVTSILRRQLGTLMKVADELFEKETVPGDNIRQLLDVKANAPWKWRKTPRWKGKGKFRVEFSSRR